MSGGCLMSLIPSLPMDNETYEQFRYRQLYFGRVPLSTVPFEGFGKFHHTTPFEFNPSEIKNESVKNKSSNISTIIAFGVGMVCGYMIR